MLADFTRHAGMYDHFGQVRRQFEGIYGANAHALVADLGLTSRQPLGAGEADGDRGAALHQRMQAQPSHDGQGERGRQPHQAQATAHLLRLGGRLFGSFQASPRSCAGCRCWYGVLPHLARVETLRGDHGDENHPGKGKRAAFGSYPLQGSELYERAEYRNHEDINI